MLLGLCVRAMKIIYMSSLDSNVNSFPSLSIGCQQTACSWRRSWQKRSNLISSPPTAELATTPARRGQSSTTSLVRASDTGLRFLTPSHPNLPSTPSTGNLYPRLLTRLLHAENGKHRPAHAANAPSRTCTAYTCSSLQANVITNSGHDDMIVRARLEHSFPPLAAYAYPARTCSSGREARNGCQRRRRIAVHRS